MCGFIGKFNPNSLSIPTVSEPKYFYKRGPDSYGEFKSEKISIIFRRLSIVDDKSRSNQPFNLNSRYVLAFNGEIYNYISLKKDLIKKGIKFTTESDTEVLYQLLINDGIGSLNKIEGIFAFAFYDLKRNYLILARDAIGIKPLFFERSEDLNFGSTYESVCSNSKNKYEFSSVDLKRFLKWQSIIFKKSSVIKDSSIGEIPPGSYYDSDKDQIFKWKKNESILSKILPSENVRLIIDKAVQLQVPKNQKFAVLLSGGIDSTILAYHLKSNKNAIFFTIGTKGSDDNEVRIAERTAKLFNLNHIKYEFSESDFFSYLDDFLNISDLPTGDGLNTFIITKIINGHGIKVALSGLGADEIFGGYGAFNSIFNNKFTDKFISKYSSFFNINRYFYQLACFFNLNYYFDKKAAFFKSYQIHDTLVKETNFSKISHYHGVRNLYFKFFLQPTLLRDVDYYSMLNSVEVRVPFLSQSLVDWAFNRSITSPTIFAGKKILYEAYKHSLPYEVINRKKTGFNIGLNYNLFSNNKVLERLIKLLNSYKFKNLFIESLKINTIKRFRKKSNPLNFRRLWLFITLVSFMVKNDSKN